MTDKDEIIPKSLIDALERRRVVPFVGAGVSMSIKKLPLEPVLDESGNQRSDKHGNIIHKSVFPSWWEFLKNAADKLDEEKIALNNEGKSQKAITIQTLLNDEPVDYLDIAQRAYDALGESRWYDLLRENFEKNIDFADEDSKKLAKLIWQLGSNLVVTTNVDSALKAVHKTPGNIRQLNTQVARLAELQQMDWRPLNPTVLHLHGSIDDETKVVFTREQYRAFYDLKNNHAKLETLRSLFTQRPILFIGFSLEDLFILRELERVNLIYKGAANSFYALIRESEKNNPNIPAYIQQINFSEFGKPLEDLVARLSQIAGNDDNEEKISEPDNQIDEKPRDNDKKKSFFNVPYNSKGKEFVGRVGHTEEIWNRLNQKNNSPIGQNISIKGFGGWGKTQLAVEYAHEYQDKYQNGVFWLVADENIDSQLLQIADKQEWINQTDKSVNQIEVAKVKFLSLSESLIIFDNVESFEDIKDYLPKPDLRNHILITSRHKLKEFREFNLELLSPNESRELLLKVSRREIPTGDESEQLEKLLETLGGIPLAIELVGGYLDEHENVSFAKYHQFLDEYPLPRLEREFPEGDFTHQDRSIIPALRISEKLVKEKPLMVEILKVLAWSGNTSMGIALLQSLVEARDEFELQNAIGDAYKLRLLKKEGEVERYAIHRLLAKVIRHENPLEQNKDWHRKIVKNLQSWFDERKRDFKYLADFEAEIEHLREWQNHTFKFLPKQSVWLFALEAYPPFQRGNYQTSLHFLEKAFNLYTTQNLSDKKLLADISNDLGTIYSHLADYEQSLKYSLQAFEIRRELFGEKHLDTATSLNNIGDVYRGLGNHKEALKYLLQSFEILRELSGEKHSDTAVSLNNIGGAYLDLGNHTEALKYLLQAFEIRRELSSEKHPNTAALLNNIGKTYLDLGNHTEALKYLSEAFEIEKELLGEKHPNTAAASNNIGGAYRGLGNHKEALKYFLQAFEIQRELLGEKHPNTILSASNLVVAYLDVGRVNDAGILAAKFLRNVPNNHPQRQFFEKFGKAYEKLARNKKKPRKKN